MSEQREREAAQLENARMIHCQWLERENERLRDALTKLETEIRNRGDAERMYIELIEAALANQSE